MKNSSAFFQLFNRKSPLTHSHTKTDLALGLQPAQLWSRIYMGNLRTKVTKHLNY